MTEDKKPNNKITIKLIWEFQVEPKQLFAILVPLLTAGWVAFQTLTHNTPVLPTTTPTTPTQPLIK